jgi:hypothetical protein
MQQVEFSMQHAGLSTRNSACRIHHAAFRMQHAAFMMQHAAFMMQHAACNRRAAGQPFLMEKLLRHASSLNGGIIFPQCDPTGRPSAEYQGPA